MNTSQNFTAKPNTNIENKVRNEDKKVARQRMLINLAIFGPTLAVVMLVILFK